jgi:hypothetical protein
MLWLTLWLIPTGCAVIMLALIVVGTIPVVGAQRNLKAKIARVQAHPTLELPAKFQRAFERIGDSALGAQAAVARTRTAIDAIGAGLRELRLREVVAVLRVGRLALRALWSLH